MLFNSVKKFLCLSISFALLSSTPIIASAAPIANDSDESINNKIESRESYLQIDEDLTSRTGSQSSSFDTTKKFQYYRIYIKNDSNVEYNVISPGGTYTVKPNNGIYLWSNKPVSSGTHKVSITSKDGSKLEGRIAIRIAKTLSEVEM